MTETTETAPRDPDVLGFPLPVTRALWPRGLEGERPRMTPARYLLVMALLGGAAPGFAVAADLPPQPAAPASAPAAYNPPVPDWIVTVGIEVLNDQVVRFGTTTPSARGRIL
jgi:hypothetical protein